MPKNLALFIRKGKAVRMSAGGNRSKPKTFYQKQDQFIFSPSVQTNLPHSLRIRTALSKNCGSNVKEIRPFVQEIAAIAVLS